MPERGQARIAIDDIVEATSSGVLRALEARKIVGPEFAKQNGFFVKIDITCGGFPGPIDRQGGGLGLPGFQAPGG